jgi:hypothetical protein
MNIRIKEPGVSGLILLAVLMLFVTTTLAQYNGVPWAARDSSADTRANQLLSQMTLDEKIQLVHGAVSTATVRRGAAGFIPGIPRLGIPICIWPMEVSAWATAWARPLHCLLPSLPLQPGIATLATRTVV